MAKNISNLDKSLKQNITPEDIGAAASSHGTHLSLGTTSSTAYRGDRGNTAYNHSQAAHAPSNAQKNSDITKSEIEAKLTGNITSHTHSSYATTTTTGALSSLQTSAKGSLVAAINEVFQSGSNAKNKLVEALTSKGTSCSTNDSWDTLIGHVSTGGGGSVDIIAKTSLPSTGKEGQVCIITQNPQTIVLTTSLNDIDNSTNNIYIYIGTTATNTYNTGVAYECSSNDMTFKLYIVKIYQAGKSLASYQYTNGSWVQYTYEYTYFIENGLETNNAQFGAVYSSSSNTSKNALVASTGAFLLRSPSDSGGYPYHIGTNNRQIDFSIYNYIEVTAYSNVSSGLSITLCCYSSAINAHYSSYKTPIHYKDRVGSFTTTASTLTYDISSWTSKGFLGLSMTTQTKNQYIYITDVRFR